MPRTDPSNSPVEVAGPVTPQKLQVLWESLRTSFWFVPALMVAAAILLSWLAHLGDEWLSVWHLDRLPPAIYVSTADNARDVIATLLASMITMTSLVFSITMVVLTLAASQFGPRLIRSFMSSPHTQYVLGTFVMTSVYCLLVLGVIGSRSVQQQQAFATVSVAILLALISLVLLVLFLHFLARSIVSETVIERVGQELDKTLDSFTPLSGSNPVEAAPLPADFDSAAAFFDFAKHGYIEAIEFERIVEAAVASDVLVRIMQAPGDYVAPGTLAIGVYPASRCNDELTGLIRKAVLIGIVRTPHQDPEFSIRHLVEIAVRALSPGINDPYTATAVINRLSAALVRITSLQLPTGEVKDKAGQTRVSVPATSYSSIFGATFNQIRQNAVGKPLVLIYLIDAIARTANSVKTNEQRDALLDQLHAITGALNGNLVDLDKGAIMAKAEAAVKMLQGR
jgi:uncharacterized membrane protein